MFQRGPSANSCPKSGFECGPCLEGFFAEKLNVGGWSEKCRPVVTGVDSGTPKTAAPNFGLELQYIIVIACLSIVVIVALAAWAWKYYKDKRSELYRQLYRQLFRRLKRQFFR